MCCIVRVMRVVMCVVVSSRRFLICVVVCVCYDRRCYVMLCDVM